MDQTALPFLFPHLRTSFPAVPQDVADGLDGPVGEPPIVQVEQEEGDQLLTQHLLCILLLVATETENKVTKNAVTNIQSIN